MKNRLIAVGVFATAMLAAVGLGSGAVTNASGGVNGNTYRNSNELSTSAYSQTISRDFKLVASGTTTKTHLHSNGTPVGNLKIWWDSPVSGGYRVTKKTMWYPGVSGWNSVGYNISNNDGTSGGNTIAYGATWTSYNITTGSLSTKAELTTVYGGGGPSLNPNCVSVVPGSGATQWGAGLGC